MPSPELTKIIILNDTLAYPFLEEPWKRYHSTVAWPMPVNNHPSDLKNALRLVIAKDTVCNVEEDLKRSFARGRRSGRDTWHESDMLGDQGADFLRGCVVK